MPKITKRGALEVTQTLDRIANVITAEAAAFNIPEKVASDFAARCDRLSDRIERVAGIDRNEDGSLRNAADYNPAEIGVEKGGPLEQDSDEPYMKGEFTQQENRELREKVQNGELNKGSDEPQSPTPGVQASFSRLAAVLSSQKPLSPAAKARVAKALYLATQVIKTAEEDAEEEESEDDGSDDEVEASKKASHGFNLFG